MNKIFDDKWKKKPTKKELYDLINCYTKEIERLNNIIEELKERSLQYSEEIDRLLDIINELEKYLNEQIQKSWEIEEQCYEDIESKLQELKGSDKE